ncbi:TraK family protein [Acinetobacter baumannii]|uniref:TraK family protein n=1 Tax=Acinetobacter baumannii TaxID=470 RepID=UPI0034E1CF25
MTDKKATRGHGRVAFLARRDEIKTLIEAGHTLREIYDERKDQLGIQYPQFTKYVARFIETEEHQRGGESPARIEGPRGNQNQPVAASTTKPERKPGPFSHDPNSGNDRDDLI